MDGYTLNMNICRSTPKLIAKFTTGPRGLVLLMSTKRLLELFDSKSESHHWFHLPLLQPVREKKEEEEEEHGRPDQTRLGEGQSRLCIPAEEATHTSLTESNDTRGAFLPRPAAARLHPSPHQVRGDIS